MQTDQQGRFRFRDLELGAWTVMAQGPSLAAKTAEVTVQDGSIAQVKLYLIRDQALSALQDMEIVIEERAETAEVTERFLKAEDISYLRVRVEMWSRPFRILRCTSTIWLGSAHYSRYGTLNSRYYLDGVMIPDVFHFGGITTVISSNAIDEVAYITKVFGALWSTTGWIGGSANQKIQKRAFERFPSIFSEFSLCARAHQ